MIPDDENIKMSSIEKIAKLQVPGWKICGKCISVFIGALVTIPKELNRWIEEICMKPSLVQLRKTVLFGIARIHKRVFDI